MKLIQDRVTNEIYFPIPYKDWELIGKPNLKMEFVSALNVRNQNRSLISEQFF